MIIQYKLIATMFFASGSLVGMGHVTQAQDVPLQEGMTDRVPSLLSLAARRAVRLAQQDDVFLESAQKFLRDRDIPDMASIIELATMDEIMSNQIQVVRKNYVKSVEEHGYCNHYAKHVFCEFGVRNFLIKHAGIITRSIFSSDNLFVLSGSHDGIIKLWSVETGQEVITIRVPIGITSISAVALRAQGEHIASTHWSNYVHIWETLDVHDGLQDPYTIELPGFHVDDIAFSQHDSLLAVLTKQDERKEDTPVIFIYDVISKKLLHKIILGSRQCKRFARIAWSPDGVFLAIAGEDVITFLNTRTWQPLCSLPSIRFLDIEWLEEQGKSLLLIKHPDDAIIIVDLSLLRLLAGPTISP